MSALDLNLICLYRINGQEWPVLPGLLALNPARKTARGREQDRLIVYLTLAGNVLYSSAEYAQITAQVAERFYATSGSVTFALKTAVEGLNATLVERNMQTAGKGGQYSLGALVLMTLRGNSVYFVQSGPTHTYQLAGGETQHFHDASLSGKGLGLSQTARMYFSQVTLNPGERLLLCAALPPNWDRSLTENRSGAALDFMRRRLLAITDTNVSAVLIQASEGSGGMNIVRPAKDEPAANSAQQPASSDQLPANSAQQPVGSDQLPASSDQKPAGSVPQLVSSGQRATPGVQQPLSAIATDSAQQAPKSSPPPKAAAQAPVKSAAVPALNAKQKPVEPKPRLSPEQRENLGQGLRVTARLLAHLLQNGRKLSEKLGAALEKLIPRLLPGEQDMESANVPNSWMAITAVAIPLMVVTIALVVYFNFGIPELYTSAFQSARNEATLAQNEQDPTALRSHWQAVLTFLDQADQIRQQNVTPESAKLRTQARNALDTLDHIVRVSYRPVFNVPLSSTLRVTHMAATDIDVYLLDDSTGTVIRGSLNGTSYSLDSSFLCRPGNYSGVNVGKLTDIIALPRSNPSGAAVIGIDASGNLLYCAVGQAPTASALKAPDVGWNHITAIAYDSNNLYLLDAAARAVWVFFGTPDIQFPDKPFFFFESQVPILLEQATSLAVNGDDLYLLYQDNHLTTCTLSRIDTSPTRCTDPAVLVDTRPGYQSGATLSDGIFSQLAFTSPPDPAVALLESHTNSIFRFSARALELQNQIQPGAGKNNPLPANTEITAMAFGPNKVLFVFVGGQAYFANDVP